MTSMIQSGALKIKGQKGLILLSGSPRDQAIQDLRRMNPAAWRRALWDKRIPGAKRTTVRRFDLFSQLIEEERARALPATLHRHGGEFQHRGHLLDGQAGEVAHFHDAVGPVIDALEMLERRV
jgi:hypothetical protein